MTDCYSKDTRRKAMASVKSKNTAPELIVRKVLHSLGYRYSLHKISLPGKPDIVLSKHGKIIFVNGCFWHGHKRCKRASIPKTNEMYWKEKIQNNAKRDKQSITKLNKDGWKVLVVWECQTKNRAELEILLLGFLNNNNSTD